MYSSPPDHDKYKMLCEKIDKIGAGTGQGYGFDGQLKLIYEWTKTGRINLKEFNALIWHLLQDMI